MTPQQRKENWLGMNWIRPVKRLSIYLRDGMACVWCGDGVEGETVLTLDHVIPTALLGSNHETNLITACKRCNSSRGKRSVKQFAKAVALYLDHDIDPAAIVARVRATSKRPLMMTEAVSLMVKRNFSQAMACAKSNGGGE